MQLAVIETSNLFVQKRFQQDPQGLIFDILKELEVRLNFNGIYFGCDAAKCSNEAADNDLVYNFVEVIALDGYAFAHSEQSKWNYMMINVECR